MLSYAHKHEVWGKVAGDDTSDLIGKVADMLCQGKSNEDIHAYLISAGQSEEQAYLTYIGATIIAGDRVSARAKVA